MLEERLAEAVRLREAGQQEEARRILLDLAAAAPDNAQVNFQAALVHDALGHEQEAVPFYEAALAHGLDGADAAGALLGLGSTYRALGAYEQAERTLRRRGRVSAQSGNAGIPGTGAIQPWQARGGDGVVAAQPGGDERRRGDRAVSPRHPLVR